MIRRDVFLKWYVKKVQAPLEEELNNFNTVHLKLKLWICTILLSTPVFIGKNSPIYQVYVKLTNMGMDLLFWSLHTFRLIQVIDAYVTVFSCCPPPSRGHQIMFHLSQDTSGWTDLYLLSSLVRAFSVSGHVRCH